MPEININNAGQYGIVADVPAHELPLNAWSAGRNVRFFDGAAHKFLGHQAVLDPPTVAPYFLMPAPSGSTYYWLYAGLAKVYTTDGVTHTNITRTVGGDYLATADDRWTGGLLHGIGILNNPNDDPQMWNPIAAGTPLAVLTNWPAATKARALRPFKNFLVALDVVKTGVRYPQMVKWSDAADPGTVPSSWDPANATKRAGEFPLSETSDYCIDCLPLRDTNIIYKENSTWGMQLIGGSQVFRFGKIFDSIGMLGPNCAVEYFSGRHATFSADDVVQHDGQNAVSVLKNKMRRWLFNRIDATNANRSFVALNPGMKTVWFCYPTSGSSFCTEAVVWNFEDGSVGVRELPNLTHAALGVVDSSALPSTWSADTETWDEDTSLWSDLTFNPALRKLLLAAPSVVKLYGADTSANFAGVSMISMVEKTGIGLPNFDTDMPPDITTRKLCTRVWPRITGTIGGVVNVYVGAQASPETAPVYGLARPYTIGTSRAIDCLVNGPLLAIKFESTSDIEWALHGYTLDVKKAGKY